MQIFIPLLNEGTEVLRPTEGISLGDSVVRVLATEDYDPDLEEWEFPPDSEVHCFVESRGGQEILVARQRVG